ncbi:MAG: imidazole glycerol phosphate synthase subunit HisH [Deltaproteobacteria bacterium]|nr:imidazole glycerol phosphate synthase subunit HisH [Deltaproteobacteria bacterium]
MKVAIIDYGMGNLFSVQHAFKYLEAYAIQTSSKKDILGADAVILPGVGAFGEAMKALKRLDLVGVLKDVAAQGKPFLGICLGIQLLMSESFEFGHHEGLNIIEGSVVRFGQERQKKPEYKIPEVGWNRIHATLHRSWNSTPLRGLKKGTFVYFVHSLYVKPKDASVTLSVSRYGDTEFCSSLLSDNIFGCQFHPEKSGTVGLKILKQFLERVAS